MLFTIFNDIHTLHLQTALRMNSQCLSGFERNPQIARTAHVNFAPQFTWVPVYRLCSQKSSRSSGTLIYRAWSRATKYYRVIPDCVRNPRNLELLRLRKFSDCAEQLYNEEHDDIVYIVAQGITVVVLASHSKHCVLEFGATLFVGSDFSAPKLNICTQVLVGVKCTLYFHQPSDVSTALLTV